MTILVFISRADSQPTPTSELVKVNSRLNDLSRGVSHCHRSAFTILIPLHPLINVVSNNTPGLRTHAYNIPDLLFLRSLMPICLSLASCQNVSVELTAKFVQAVGLCSFAKTSKLLKFSIMTQMQYTLCPSIILQLQEVSNLLWDLKLCGLLVLCNLICGGS